MERETYSVGADSILESLNIQPLLIPSVAYGFCAYNESLTDEYIYRYGYANHTKGARSSTAADKLIHKRVIFSSGNKYRFPSVDYLRSHRSRGNYSTFYEIDFFLLVVSALLEHVFY